MKRILFVLLWLLAFPLAASHIVGGEFEIIHRIGYRYSINLIVYFDEVHGHPNNKIQDRIITARIFRVSDNSIVTDVFLNFTEETHVNYTNTECAIDDLETSRMFYTTDVTLSPAVYNDPQGYYIVWERCCRNYTIKNIFSQDPTAGGVGAGQTFYLKFPPVVVNGEQFINSSPTLFRPLSDYACIGQPYYADFSGVDADGDSLAYTMVTPFTTHSVEPYPLMRPEPYPLISWRNPYSLNNIMNGDPDLTISADGLLTVTPTNDPGIFVFAVKCEEFRNGVKIGETRRDFQMLVTDCRLAVPPKITARTAAGPLTENKLTVVFPNSTEDEDRCITVRVSDQDAFNLADGQREFVGIRAIPIGFKADLSGILPETVSTTLSPDKPYIEFPVCFERCPIKPGPLKIGIIAYDDACALPLLDTIVLTVTVVPPDNRDPYFAVPVVDQVLEEGTEEVWDIIGRDDDLDPLEVQILPDNFVLADAGFFLENEVLENGSYTARLRWDADCREFDFTQRTHFTIRFMLNDVDTCLNNGPVFMTFNLEVRLPEFDPPVIGSTLSPEEIENGIERKVFETLDFTVFGDDSDNNPLTLRLHTSGFSASEYGMSFPSDTADFHVESAFHMSVPCTQGQLPLSFIVTDSRDYCGVYRADTLDVNLHILPPDNISPELTVTNLSADIPSVDGELQMVMGQTVSLELRAEDPDTNPVDHVSIQLIGAYGNVQPSGYTFTPSTGTGSAQATFSWRPECAAFENRVYENDYVFRFRAVDNRCYNIKADTVEVPVNLRDVDGSDVNFVPPNFITPNGDGCNDYFALEEIDNTPCGEIHIPQLPKDNCAGKFSHIRIYNRWGKELYRSNRRNFRWYAGSQAAGVYFYTIFYTNREYKGSVTVMY